VKSVVTLLRELYGLFVEDGAFALAILVWLGLFAAIVSYVEASVRGPVLFAGFAVILIVAVRRASRHAPPGL
jgi:hypothetical protein